MHPLAPKIIFCMCFSLEYILITLHLCKTDKLNFKRLEKWLGWFLNFLASFLFICIVLYLLHKVLQVVLTGAITAHYHRTVKLHCKFTWNKIRIFSRYLGTHTISHTISQSLYTHSNNESVCTQTHLLCTFVNFSHQPAHLYQQFQRLAKMTSTLHNTELRPESGRSLCCRPIQHEALSPDSYCEKVRAGFHKSRFHCLVHGLNARSLMR